MKYNNREVREFLQQSNNIEQEYGEIALNSSILAWEYAEKNKYNITTKYILNIHKKLLQKIRPDIAGKLRNCSVKIGGHVKVFISQALLSEQLRTWVIDYISAKTEEDIKKAHIAFEFIHPFEDGNGRTGRILMNIQRIKTKSLPILIIKGIEKGDEELPKDQRNYYSWFK